MRSRPLPKRRAVPTLATAARPGSREKIEIMRYRQAHGQQLHHPDDNRQPIHPDDLPPWLGAERRGAVNG